MSGKAKATTAIPRLTRQHSNEVYTKDNKFFQNLIHGLKPNVPVNQNGIIFF